MRIVLKKIRLYIIENLIPPILNKDINNEVRTKYQCHVDNDEQATSVMLVSTSLEQKYHENMDAYVVIMHFKELFDV
jgi:hypothetical protein